MDRQRYVSNPRSDWCFCSCSMVKDTYSEESFFGILDFGDFPIFTLLYLVYLSFIWHGVIICIKLYNKNREMLMGANVW